MKANRKQNSRTAQSNRSFAGSTGPVCVESLESRTFLSASPALVPALSKAVSFIDSFSPAASSKWNDYSGGWTSSDGTYFAQIPAGGPSPEPAVSDLPYTLSDLTVNVQANNLTDGGMTFGGNGTNELTQGVYLILGGNNYGQGGRGGTAGTSAYWVTNPGPVVHDEVDNVFTPGQTYQISVTVTGDVLSLYVNGGTAPITTFTDPSYSAGTVGLYDDQPNTAYGGSGAPMTYSNFSLSGTEVPSSQNSASLTPTLKGKLPAAGIAGQKLSIAQTLTLANANTTVYSGSTTTQWFLDTGNFIDPDAISLTTAATRTLKLKANGKTSIGLNLKALPSDIPGGTYYLIARVTDSSGNSSQVATPSTITIAEPTVVLSSSLGALKKIHSGDTLTLTNSGNITDTGKFTVAVGFSTDAAGEIPAGTAVTTVKAITLKPLKPARLHVAASKLQLASLVSDLSYYLTVTITDPSGRTTTAVSPDSFLI